MCTSKLVEQSRVGRFSWPETKQDLELVDLYFDEIVYDKELENIGKGGVLFSGGVPKFKLIGVLCGDYQRIG